MLSRAKAMLQVEAWRRLKSSLRALLAFVFFCLQAVMLRLLFFLGNFKFLILTVNDMLHVIVDPTDSHKVISHPLMSTLE